MRVTKDNARILHYLGGSTPIYILEIEGKRYISTFNTFLEDTIKNRNRMILKNSINSDKLSQLDKSPSVEWCDLKDGSYMFSESYIEEFKIDLPKLEDGYSMFYRSKLKKFKSTLPNLVKGRYMFAKSLLKKFKSDLPKLVDGCSMFFESLLKKFKSDLPKLKNREYMFGKTPFERLRSK